MWSHQYLKRIDFRTLPILLGLIFMSLLVISSTTIESWEVASDEPFFTSYTKGQLKWFGIGAFFYIFFAGLDYRKLKKWSWFLYVGMIIMLIGLFFTAPIQNVQRWYRLPGLGMMFQPS